jgi:hypothetical protein
MTCKRNCRKLGSSEDRNDVEGKDQRNTILKFTHLDSRSLQAPLSPGIEVDYNITVQHLMRRQRPQQLVQHPE